MMKSLVGESESNLRRAILSANAMGAVIVTGAERKPVGRDVVQVIRQAQGRAAVERLSGVPEVWSIAERHP